MPTYLNSTDTTILVDNPATTLAPGDNALDYYLKSLPTGVTLKSHTPAVKPWELLDDITSAPMAEVLSVAAFPKIAVYNASNAVCTVSANTDDSSAYTVLAGVKEVFSNSDGLFGVLKILPMGTGTVYIYGLNQ